MLRRRGPHRVTKEEILQQLPQDWAASSELLELLAFTIGSQLQVTPELWNEILG